jgi:hypothetical protein
LRRPFADAAGGAQPLQRIAEAAIRVEQAWLCDCGQRRRFRKAAVFVHDARRELNAALQQRFSKQSSKLVM